MEGRLAGDIGADEAIGRAEGDGVHWEVGEHRGKGLIRATEADCGDAGVGVGGAFAAAVDGEIEAAFDGDAVDGDGVSDGGAGGVLEALLEPLDVGEVVGAGLLEVDGAGAGMGVGGGQHYLAGSQAELCVRPTAEGEDD